MKQEEIVKLMLKDIKTDLGITNSKLEKINSDLEDIRKELSELVLRRKDIMTLIENIEETTISVGVLLRVENSLNEINSFIKEKKEKEQKLFLQMRNFEVGAELLTVELSRAEQIQNNTLTTVAPIIIITKPSCYYDDSNYYIMSYVFVDMNDHDRVMCYYNMYYKEKQIQQLFVDLEDIAKDNRLAAIYLKGYLELVNDRPVMSYVGDKEDKINNLGLLVKKTEKYEEVVQKKKEDNRVDIIIEHVKEHLRSEKIPSKEEINEMFGKALEELNNVNTDKVFEFMKEIGF